MRKRSAAIIFLYLPTSIILFILLLTLPVRASDFSMAQVQAHIKNRLAGQQADGVLAIRGEMVCGMEMMPLAYRGRAYMPYWIDASLRLNAAKALIEAVGRAREDGLRPSDYHSKAIYRLLAEIAEERSATNRGSPKRWADLDLVLTDAFLLLGTHLRVGRVNPETRHGNWKIDPGRTRLLPLLNRAAETGDMATALEALRPLHEGYRALRRALARLREIDANGGWPMLDHSLPLHLVPGSDGAAALHRRLVFGGDDDPANQGSDKAHFKADLTEAVKRFQRRHGLSDDGIVGPETLAVLNVSAQERIRQVEINLERWRWLPHRLENRYVDVNMAAFSLEAVQAGQVRLTIRVAVGRPARRSPVFSSKITNMVVNPYWNIPRTIAVEDILPEVKKHAAYLRERGIRVYENWRPNAAEIDPATVDWQAYDAGRFPFNFRQDPGPRNGLGRIKFILPNAYDVYLHDTPDHSIFERVQRDLSSGCIRVAAPVALANFVLTEDDEWSSEALSGLIASGKTVKIALRHPVPVRLLYMTAWVDKQGRTQFRKDIYDRDGALDLALNQQPPKPPGNP